MLEPARDEPTVLLRALSELRATASSRRYWSRLRLTDHGTHVEYSDGTRTQRWRLPDQPGDAPVLATVLIVRYPTVRWTSVWEAVLFLDPAGRALGRFTPYGGAPMSTISQVLPLQVYAPLRSRGVEIRRQQLPSADRFHRSYPDLDSNPILRRLRRPSPVVIGMVIAVIVAIVLLIETLNGTLA